MTLLASREERSLINEAKLIAPGVENVKRSFAPGSYDNFAGTVSMNVSVRKAIQCFGLFVNLIEIAGREIDVVGNGFGVSPSDVTSTRARITGPQSI